MGTSNFSRLKNASKYYTIFMNVEEKFVKCDECNTKFVEWESEYEKIENLFSEVCDNRLELVGTFSNGESIYREIK